MLSNCDWEITPKSKVKEQLRKICQPCDLSHTQHMHIYEMKNGGGLKNMDTTFPT